MSLNVGIEQVYKYDPDIHMPNILRKVIRHENHVKERIKEIMDLFKGCEHWPVGASAYARRTVDRMACYRGYFIAIEAKYGNNEPTALQQKFLTDIELTGGFSICVSEKNLQQLYDAMVYISTLPFGGREEVIPLSITDRVQTASTYRNMEEQVR